MIERSINTVKQSGQRAVARLERKGLVTMDGITKRSSLVVTELLALQTVLGDHFSAGMALTCVLVHFTFEVLTD